MHTLARISSFNNFLKQQQEAGLPTSVLAPITVHSLTGDSDFSKRHQISSLPCLEFFCEPTTGNKVQNFHHKILVAYWPCLTGPLAICPSCNSPPFSVCSTHINLLSVLEFEACSTSRLLLWHFHLPVAFSPSFFPSLLLWVFQCQLKCHFLREGFCDSLSEGVTH